MPAHPIRRQLARLLTLSAALALAGCMHHGQGPGSVHAAGRAGGPDDHGRAPDSSNPRVFVTNGRITVDQEPLRFYKAQGKVKITWRLPQQSPYVFPKDGIVIEPYGRGTQAQNPAEEFSCALGQNPKHFTCENRNSGPGLYKYTVRVLDGDKPLDPLDPVIVNDW